MISGKWFGKNPPKKALSAPTNSNCSKRTTLKRIITETETARFSDSTRKKSSVRNYIISCRASCAEKWSRWSVWDAPPTVRFCRAKIWKFYRQFPATSPSPSKTVCFIRNRKHAPKNSHCLKNLTNQSSNQSMSAWLRLTKTDASRDVIRRLKRWWIWAANKPSANSSKMFLMRVLL